MDSNDPTENERSDEAEIRAFLARESSRRTRQRPTDADVVAMIRGQRTRHLPAQTMAGLLAAVLTVAFAVVVALLVMRPSGGIGSGPSPSSSERPLKLPTVGVGQPCPVSTTSEPGDGQTALLGDGPVRLRLPNAAGSAFFEDAPGGRWKGMDVLWTATPAFTGKALVRGARLDGPGELGFGDPVEPMHELEIDSATKPAISIDGRSVVARTAIRLKVAGCYGIQIDTGERSSIVVFEAKPIEEAFARLERSLQLPNPGRSTCPATSTTGSVPFIHVALGTGPIYLAGGSSVSLANSAQSDGDRLIKQVWIADPREPGPILIRGDRIDAPGDVRFDGGSEPTHELRLPILSYESTSNQPPGWRIFNSYLGVSSPGCYAMQVDTLSSSRWLVFEVTP
jgi:hypothetical protein